MVKSSLACRNCSSSCSDQSPRVIGELTPILLPSIGIMAIAKLKLQFLVVGSQTPLPSATTASSLIHEFDMAFTVLASAISSFSRGGSSHPVGPAMANSTAAAPAATPGAASAAAPTAASAMSSAAVPATAQAAPTAAPATPQRDCTVADPVATVLPPTASASRSGCSRVQLSPRALEIKLRIDSQRRRREREREERLQKLSQKREREQQQKMLRCSPRINAKTAAGVKDEALAGKAKARTTKSTKSTGKMAKDEASEELSATQGFDELFAFTNSAMRLARESGMMVMVAYPPRGNATTKRK